MVDRGELAGDLLAVRPPAAGHLVHGDVDLPPGPGPAHPQGRMGVPEREALRGQVVGMAYVDDRVTVRPGVRVRLAQDRVDGRDGGRGPPGEHPRALERVPGPRANPEHPAPPPA